VVRYRYTAILVMIPLILMALVPVACTLKSKSTATHQTEEQKGDNNMSVDVEGTMHERSLELQEFWELETDNGELFVLDNPPYQIQVEGLKVRCSLTIISDDASTIMRGQFAKVNSYKVR
jgi:hypothetical protein